MATGRSKFTLDTALTRLELNSSMSEDDNTEVLDIDNQDTELADIDVGASTSRPGYKASTSSAPDNLEQVDTSHDTDDSNSPGADEKIVGETGVEM